MLILGGGSSMTQQTVKKTTRTVYVRSDLGWIFINGDDDGINAVDFVKDRSFSPPEDCVFAGEPGTARHAVDRCAAQLLEYLRGERISFDVPLKPSGTPFQQTVWRELQGIGCGETVSYGDIARAVGNPKGVRAVGGAIGRNPISILVPCHRVIGSNGKLTGYAGELWRKEWLLKHEQSIVSRNRAKLGALTS
jgi:methylated-DNA-[protein]-cysteine S-methyltransferase